MILLSSASLVFAEVKSPKQQLERGVAPEDIVCREDLILAILFEKNPVCLTKPTAEALQKRPHVVITFPEPSPQKADDAPKVEKPQQTKSTQSGAAIRGNTGKAQASIQTVPASSLSIVNFYVIDDDLNTSRSGVDIISTAGLLEFSINGVSIPGPDTIIETGPNTGKFYGRLDLPDTINGNPITQDDIIQIRYLDESGASGASSTSVTSIPLSKTYAQVQASGSGQTRIGHEFTLRIYEPDANLDSREVDRIPLSRIEFRAEGGIRTTLANDAFDANSSNLLETGENTGVFEVVIKIPRTISGKTIHIGDWYEIRYIDTTTPSNTNEKIVLKGKIG